MSIPLVIHQTWKDTHLPQSFGKMASSWKEKHPRWNYMLWTDEMNRAFVAAHFSSFLTKYDGYDTNIQRVDAVRYLILYSYGGVFVDLDMECLNNVAPLLHSAECVFAKEPEEHCHLHNKSHIISNAFMATVPRHPFFESIIKELNNEQYITNHPNDKILESTGPFMLSRVFTAYEQKEDITILESDKIYPLTKEQLQQHDATGHRWQEKLQNAYAIHHYAGTWWKKK